MKFFTSNVARADGLNGYCSDCHRCYTQDHYKKNKAEYVRRAMATAKQLRALLRELKSLPCADCKNEFPHYVMDFDHVRGKKLFTMAHGYRKGRLLLLQEAKKCDVVCSNCHRERTWQRTWKRLKKRS